MVVWMGEGRKGLSWPPLLGMIKPGLLSQGRGFQAASHSSQFGGTWLSGSENGESGFVSWFGSKGGGERGRVGYFPMSRFLRSLWSSCCNSRAFDRFICLWQRGQSSGSTAQVRRISARQRIHLGLGALGGVASMAPVWADLGLSLPSALANHPA